VVRVLSYCWSNNGVQEVRAKRLRRPRKERHSRQHKPMHSPARLPNGFRGMHSRLVRPPLRH